MSLTMIKVFLAIACAGHVLCCFCDRAITYAPGGRFNFKDLGDNDKLAATFEGMSLKKQLFSMLAGVLALTMTCLGYIALYEYVGAYSRVCGTILLISLAADDDFGNRPSRILRSRGVVLYKTGKNGRGSPGYSGIFQKNVVHDVRLLYRRDSVCDNSVRCRRLRHNRTSEMGVRIQRHTDVYRAASGSE